MSGRRFGARAGVGRTRFFGDGRGSAVTGSLRRLAGRRAATFPAARETAFLTRVTGDAFLRLAGLFCDFFGRAMANQFLSCKISARECRSEERRGGNE